MTAEVARSEGRLEFAEVEKTFPAKGGGYRALDPTSLQIEAGEFVALVGPSGCGKSTILRLVAGLEEYTSGRILMDGEPVTAPGPDRGMVFQDHALLPWMSVFDNVLFALECNPRGRSREECREATREYLDLVHLSRFADQRPSRLSGGMKQRVGLARTFALDPKVLLMDEPFGSLDALTRGVMQSELLRIWESSRVTVLLVTHDVDEALLLADRVVVMSQGPQARVKAEVDVPFDRPRDQNEVLASEEYPKLRRELLDILAEEVAA